MTNTTRLQPPNRPLDADVFLVEDDPAIQELLHDTLSITNCRITTFSSGALLLSSLKTESPQALIVDLGLPDIDGIALIEMIRNRCAAPILVLSARSAANDRVLGLEMGADDYLCKPFDPREVVARLRALLRRSTPAQAPQEKQRASFGGWLFEPDTYKLIADDGEASFLSTGEAQLLTALINSSGRVLSRDLLLDACGGEDSLDRAIDVRISRIRKKLASKGRFRPIRTVYGSGYMFTAPVKWH
ncbi:response regulator transcription factor [Polycladidibacter hongkongensis]|uniref:response regulator transcription factor n=1 Tax=Polycladidibacter hongkongensis TaxID=1647556 RepID=UPI000A906A30|nr:response regulator transcription factor [Pseudovibrio hongkongensis]